MPEMLTIPTRVHLLHLGQDNMSSRGQSGCMEAHAIQLNYWLTTTLLMLFIFVHPIISTAALQVLL